MQLSRLFFLLALALAPVALIGTTWLYLYPFFDAACAFPSPPNSSGPAPFRLLALGDPQLEGNTALYKARSKLFRSFDHLIDNVRDADTLPEKWTLVRDAVGGVPKDVLRALEGYVRKPLDIWGNDLYLAHIVRTLRWWTAPTHVAVLGDLLGSQWIGDEEFERRSGRYWGRVFRGMERVPEGVMSGYAEDENDAGEENIEEVQDEEGVTGEQQDEEEKPQREEKWGGTVEVLGQNPAWANRAINIAGNHDIGYAGDIDAHRIERFERTYGRVNWDIVFTLPNTTLADPSSPPESDVPALRLIILNTMNLDTPAFDTDLQRETYDFINHIITTSRSVNDKTHATILLTHIPLHKESGVCVDSPFFDFFDGGSGVKEQNMLSEHASKIVLESVFGLSGNPHAEGGGFGRRGVVVNGHDHAGCDVLHWTTRPGESGCAEVGGEDRVGNSSAEMGAGEVVLEDSIAANETLADADADAETQSLDADSPPSPESSDPTWHTTRLPLPSNPNPSTCPAPTSLPSLREITLRSMMGEFSGYAGFLSAWFDTSLGEKGEWVIESSTCGVGVQHWWWGVHVVDGICVLVVVIWMGLRVFEGMGKDGEKGGKGKEGDGVNESKERGKIIKI